MFQFLIAQELKEKHFKEGPITDKLITKSDQNQM